MSVIIRLQNLPWSANALDIRNFFRGLSIPEGGVHIVGGELGDAFIAFSTDEDARQAMILDGGKIKEIQVKLLLSSRSEMHKVIETARQSVPILNLVPPAPTPAPVHLPVASPVPAQVPQALPAITPFTTALGSNTLSGFGIPGIGIPQEIPQPAVIEPPAPLISPSAINSKLDWDEEKEEERMDKSRSREKDRRRSRSRSRSRDRERKERKRDRRDRSRSRERRRRDRSRSRDRRKRDRKDRSRSRDRSPSRRSRDRRNERKSPGNSQEKIMENPSFDIPAAPAVTVFSNNLKPDTQVQMPASLLNGPVKTNSDPTLTRFSDPTIADAYNKLQELGMKRNPNAFQGENTNGVGKPLGRADAPRGGSNVGGFRREGRSRFDNNQQTGCCVAIRSAPNHTSYGDVRRFFPFLIDQHGIKMINDNMGRRTGNIYVRFCDTRSKNLALQRKDNELKGAQVIVEHLDDDIYGKAVDSYLPFREDNDEEDSSLVIADAEENAQQPFTVIKLSELPNFVKEHDIIKTFSDFSLLSIMLTDCRVTRSKIAFVQFAKPDEAKLAYDLKESYMFGRRQPTLTPVTAEEFEKETKKNDKSSDVSHNAEKVLTQEKMIPRDPRQRRQFDSPLLQKPPLVPTPPQSGTFFSAPFVQQQGFPPAGFNGPQFGGYPPVTGSVDPRTAAANWANRPQFPNASNLFEKSNSPSIGKRVLTTDMDEEPLDCVLMKGLPREATDRTIVTFLSDTGAVPARIHLMLDSNGLPSGDCFCEFRSSQEARMAATKHGNNLDGCRVTVDLVPRTVVEEALEGPKQPESLLNAGPPSQFYDSARGGFGPRGPYRGRGSYDRGGFVRGGFEMGRGGFRGRGAGFGDRGGFNERGRGGSFDRGRGRGRGFAHARGFENGRDEEHDPALADFGVPGCIVSMENVPFRATIEEIMQFFSDFELTHDDVIRRYNERGQPTGDARVAFRTPFDAQRAVKTRNMGSIHDRRVSLNII